MTGGGDEKGEGAEKEKGEKGEKEEKEEDVEEEGGRKECARRLPEACLPQGPSTGGANYTWKGPGGMAIEVGRVEGPE